VIGQLGNFNSNNDGRGRKWQCYDEELREQRARDIEAEMLKEGKLLYVYLSSHK
jgi:hypothetical protein